MNINNTIVKKTENQTCKGGNANNLNVETH